MPAFLLDRRGQICWVNDAARRLTGDVVGRSFTDAVAPGDRGQARTVFARKLLGSAPATDVQLTLVAADGRPVPVELSSAALPDNGRIVGVFGLARLLGRAPVEEPGLPRPTLTSRQLDILRLLVDGRSTGEIATELGLSKETVRNHVRGVLRGLHAHSRLEAVVKAAALGLIEL